MSEPDQPTRALGLAAAASMAVQHGVVVHAADGAILWTNPAASVILGLTEDQLLGRHPVDPSWRAVHEDGAPWPGDTHPAMQTLATGIPVLGSIMGVHRPGGTLVWLSVSSVATPLDDGSTGVTATFGDVTRIKGAVEQQRMMFEHGGIPTAVLDDATGTVLDVNQAAIDWLGYSREELVGRAVPTLIRPEGPARRDRDDGDQPFQRMERVVRFRHQDRSIRWGTFIAQALPRLEGSSRSIIVHALDITAQKEAEQRVEQGHELYRDTIEALRQPVFVCRSVRDVRGSIIDFEVIFGNTSAAAIWTRRREELPGLRLLDVLPSIVDEGRFAPICDVVATGEPFNYLSSSPPEMPFGRTFLVHVAKAGDGFVSTLNDVTEQREQERSLEHATRLDSIAVLAGGIAHDFNNLLVAILGNLEMASADLGPGSATGMLIDEAHRAGERASVLTRQLMAYARSNPPLLQQVDIAALFEGESGALRARVHDPIRLVVDVPDGLPPIRVDRGQLAEVIRSLVDNAVEAIGAGPGQVAIRAEVREFTAEELAVASPVDLPPAGSYVCISIADDGEGLTPEAQAKAFDPFYSTRFTGRGLGLAAAYGVMRALDGFITCTSEEGRGATFALHLHPMTPPAG